MQADEIREKGRELFSLCDSESKGFITRNDLNHLDQDLTLSGDQLATVFDGLDEDGNGYLTLDEFVDGFVDHVTKGQGTKQESRKSEDDSFDALLDHLGARNLFQDEEMVQAVWNHLRQQEPAVVLEFEQFLSKICSELKRRHSENNTLQTALESKVSTYETQIKKLYEEMESQLKAEKDRILQEEQEKERRMRGELEEQLEQKDKCLQEMLASQTEVERRLEELNVNETETKCVNFQLQKEKETLEQQLTASQGAISELQKNVEFLRQQNLEEKRRRARAALHVSESIALEREELVKQLDLLKVINKQLQDERDEQVERISRAQSPDGSDKLSSIGENMMMQSTDSGWANGRTVTHRLIKRGSVMSDYMEPSRGIGRNRLISNTASRGSLDDGIECDQDVFEIDNATLGKMCNDRDEVTSYHAFMKPEPEIYSFSKPKMSEGSTGSNSMMEDFLATSSKEAFVEKLSNGQEEEDELWNMETHARDAARKPKAIPATSDPPLPKKGNPFNPQRVFKVVFIGDSGVGKSSFIHRFCNNAFRATFSATIGVDFQIKHVESNGQVVVMQLWDTAGQERFRSITHQYMRKADGVVVVYDITSEMSFKNVRNWLSSVKEVSEDDIAILIVGNKSDLCTSNSLRVVRASDGMRLAEECNGLFFETSVKDNIGIVEAMSALAGRLQEKEDLSIERALQLHLQTTRKRRCCS